MPFNDPLNPSDDRNTLIPAVTPPKRIDLIPQQQRAPQEDFGGFFDQSAANNQAGDGENFGGFFDKTPAQATTKPVKEQGDFSRGFKEAYQQVPQLARGLQAIAGATAEKVVGEGGLATAIKKSGVEGFQKAGDEIAKGAKDSDSWNFAYDKAKKGDFGSLVDWLQHGLGYVGGQATQMLATAGAGSLVGKAAVGTVAKNIAEGMVAKEAARIAATQTGAKLGKDEVQQLATKAVTDKFSRLGQNAALAGTAVGMEGGEIGGDLATKAAQEGRQLTGAELGKAFMATLAAGGLEFVGDRLGLDILLGKSPLLKPAGSMPGVKGRLARGAIAGTAAAPIEGATEFGQTMIEEAGKGNDPFSPATMKHAGDAGMLGVLGGGSIGTLGGLFSSAQAAQQKADEETKNTGVEHEVQPHPEQSDKFVVVPKTRSASGVPLELDPSGSLAPAQPASTQSDFNIANKPGFMLSAEDKIRQRGLEQQREADYAANPLAIIAGKPVTELSNNVLTYTAQRGGERAKTVAVAELARRNAQGVDPAIANAPESTTDAVDRIILTGKDRAQDIRNQQQPASNPVEKQEVTPDAPTPEPVETLNAQLTALAEGRKPGVLVTPGESLPNELPQGVKLADVPGRGTLLYRDDATLQAAMSGQMGAALGYGIDEKPASATHVVTARDQNGTVIQDVATDGRPQAAQAAAVAAGQNGTVEVRPIEKAMAERAANSPEFDGIKTQEPITHKPNDSAVSEPKTGDLPITPNTELGNPATASNQVVAPIAESNSAESRPIKIASAASVKEAQPAPSAPSIKDDSHITGKKDKPFATKTAASAAILRQKQKPSDFDIKQVNGGFVAIRKESPKVDHAAISDGVRRQQKIEEDLRLDSLYKKLMSSNESQVAGLSKTVSVEDAQYVLDRLDSVPGDNPVVRKAMETVKQPGNNESASGSREKDQQAKTPTASPKAEAAPDSSLRPLVESLIKRRAAAKQGGKDLSNAIDRAKEVMEGKRTDATVENRWFRLQAKAFEKADQESANILRQIGEAVKPKEAVAKSLAEPAAVKSPDKAASVADSAKPAKSESSIQDFGEKIGGARKDMVAAMTQEWSDDDIASQPLSKIWPASDVDVLDDKFTAAVAYAARAEIPSKPRTNYKVARWVEKVKLVRGLARMILDGSVSKDRFVEKLKDFRGLEKFHAKVSLLEAVDRKSWSRIGKVAEYPEAVRYDSNGKKTRSPYVSVEIDGRNQNFDGAVSVADVVVRVNALLGNERDAAKMQFEVRGREGAYFINKKGDKEYRKLKTFATSAEAFKYRVNNYDDLVSAWEAVKERDNVKKTDVRGTENRPRSGSDYRKGKDITTGQFSGTFGFRGVEFGNWVAQGGNAKERQGMLNQAYDALMDLANIVGVPPKAISLNGDLGLGFGSRGHGWASAHFEPDMLVINLTKTRGAGTLAHEWFHALDNYFQRQRGAGNIRELMYTTYSPETYYEYADGKQRISAKEFEAAVSGESSRLRIYKPQDWKKVEGVRPEVADAFADLVKALNASPMAARSALIDAEKSDGYWSRIIERAARAFENYVISKMMQNGYNNDYLANIVSIDKFNRDHGRYPYLLENEIAPIEDAFDNLFGTIKTKETDKGVAMFSRAPDTQDVTFANDVLTELAGVDELFRHKLSHRTSLKGVFEDVYPGAEYVGDGTRPDERDESGADHRYVFKSPDGKQFYVYERDNGEVFIDVSHFAKGERGQAVYAAVGNYAFNTNKKFIGDPAGLTADSLIRRTSNMLSLALRFGSTRFMEAAPQQIAGDPKNGVEPLDWSGNDLAKTQALIHTFITTLHNKLPAIKNAKYDFSRGKFVNRLGMPLDRAAFQRIASSGVGQEGRAGEATMRRGILIQSLISSSGIERSGILEQVLNGSGALVRRGKLEGIFSRHKAESKAKQATPPGGLSVSGLSKAKVQSIVDAITSGWANAPQIVVVADMSDPAIPKAVRDENERQLSQGASGRPTAFFATGKVFVVASEMHGASDVMRAVLHEAYGHAGLRGKFREELRPILKQVSALRRKDVEAKAQQYGLDMSVESDRLLAAEEVLAELAQTNPQIGFVKRAIAAIRAWLRKNIPAFSKMEMTDGEIIHSFLMPAREFIRSGAQPAGNKTGDIAQAQPVFSRSGGAASPIRDRVDSIVDSLIYNFQDRFKPLRDIQKRAGAVPEDQDASLAEERYSGMVRARTDDFHDDMRDPLIKAIHDSKLKYEEVEEYLHALHAPSRNAAMREINPTQAELDQQTGTLTAQRDKLAKDADVEEYVKTRRELRQAEADIEDGIADESLGRMLKQDLVKLRQVPAVKDYTDAVDKLRALRGVKPFTGDNTALSGMSNDESKAIIAKAKQDGKEAALQRISGMVDGITTKTRDIFVQAGLEKQETIDAWDAKYEHYVPLHRDEVGGTGNPAIGQGFNVRGRESKRATGSNKEVTHILAHVVAQHEAAIIRAEKTKVDRALFEFAKSHPDTSVWSIDTADTKRVVDPVSGLAVDRVDPLYKMRPNVLTFKIDGEEHTITFTESNPEAMRLATSMKNLGAEKLGEVTQMVGKFTRFLATMSTTANPVFIARNFMRDLQTSFVNLSDTELAGMKKQVFADVPKAIRGMWRMARGDKNSQWAKYATEFRNAGGQIGWMDHYKNIGERADKLKKQLETMGPGKLNFTKRQATAWWDIIEDANGAVENGVRLAAYVNARKAGLSEGKAASIAKNLTVNFNRHGAKGVELNMWYMFMNASIQGTARLLQAMGNKQVQRIVGGVVASGFLMDILARSLAGDDDDDGENDYDQLPEHTKAMNFVFWAGNRPVTIPMPYGYNFFASVGRKMSEVIFRENYSPVKSGVDLASVFLDAFSPVGQAGSMLQYAAPTVADPFIQWAENKNFAGIPLRREQHPFGVPKPEYQMGFKSTSAPAKAIAELLNDQTGGNEVRPGFINMNPALFDFAVSSIAGGAGRTYLQAFSLPIKAAQDEDIKAREVPFANIFLSAKPEYQTERKYFDNIKKVQLVQEELKNFRGDPEKIRELREEHGNELKLAVLATYTKAVLSNIRKQEARIDQTDPPNKRELKTQLEEKKRAAMARFNSRYVEATR